ncbi:hypothetical protein, partial [Staphylococcus aureus]
DGHVVEESGMEEIEKHNAEITKHVQNEAAEREQHVEERTLQSVNQQKQTEKVSALSKSPFNVVMTPADKKRMMDREKNSRVNVPELKPVQSEQA